MRAFRLGKSRLCPGRASCVTRWRCPMTVELQEMRWAVTVSQHRSLRRAAETLHVRQSTLSRRMQGPRTPSWRQTVRAHEWWHPADRCRTGVLRTRPLRIPDPADHRFRSHSINVPVVIDQAGSVPAHKGNRPQPHRWAGELGVLPLMPCPPEREPPSDSGVIDRGWNE